MDDDIIRFMVATDNHLGYCERDPIRCNDSFAAFEEVLRNAVAKKVDFILLAGDMFQENKPSRRTLHSTMELLRKYCFGSHPVYIEVLNEQSEIFKTSMGAVNYEDPYHSISLPIFSIHGNHDDPSRDGGSGDALAALDLLAVSNLINYYGKSDNVDDIEIVPILIRKGTTKIALYGLGAIRDERLNRMWNQKKVKFVRLSQEQNRDEFFNIFVIHQNRDYGRGKKNCVHESMIPDWMDLVIWGNEHECIPQLQESLVGTYRILQPGSSVACSLSRGESMSCPKHMSYFEVKERKFRMKPIRFTQVRQFIYDEISLRDHVNIDTNAVKMDEKSIAVLRNKAHGMIKEARQDIKEEENVGLPPSRFKLIEPNKVLLRLKVDYDGFNNVNNHRFGSEFLGEVANPGDMLLLTKKRREVKSEKEGVTAQGILRQMLEEGEEDEIHRIRIEDLVNETLKNSKYSLSLLKESDMAQALDDYIVKKVPSAIQDLVTLSLENMQKQLVKENTGGDKDAILKAVEINKSSLEGVTQTAKYKSSTAAAAPSLDFDDEDSVAAEPVKEKKGRKPAAKTTTSAAKAPRATKTTKSKKADKIEEEEEEELEEEVVAAPKRRTARKTTAKSYIDLADSEEDDIEEPKSDDDDKMLVDSESEAEMPVSRRGKAKAPAAKAAKTPRAPKATKAVEKPKPSPPPVIEEPEVEIEEPFVISTSSAAPAKKKRQLPLSFTQSSSSNAKLNKAKQLSNDWDA